MQAVNRILGLKRIWPLGAEPSYPSAAWHCCLRRRWSTPAIQAMLVHRCNPVRISCGLCGALRDGCYSSIAVAASVPSWSKRKNQFAEQSKDSADECEIVVLKVETHSCMQSEVRLIQGRAVVPYGRSVAGSGQGLMTGVDSPGLRWNTSLNWFEVAWLFM